jgi:hypothetical protein
MIPLYVMFLRVESRESPREAVSRLSFSSIDRSPRVRRSSSVVVVCWCVCVALGPVCVWLTLTYLFHNIDGKGKERKEQGSLFSVGSKCNTKIAGS